MNKAKMFHANRARMGAENIIDVSRTDFFFCIFVHFLSYGKSAIAHKFMTLSF